MVKDKIKIGVLMKPTPPGVYLLFSENGKWYKLLDVSNFYMRGGVGKWQTYWNKPP